MRWIDLMRMAFSALGQHKVRTALTTLGIIFGSAVMLFTLSMTQGVQDTIQREYARIDALQHVTVYAGTAGQNKIPEDLIQFPEGISEERKKRLIAEITRRWERESSSTRILPITPQVLDDLRKLPHVKRVTPILYMNQFLVYRRQSRPILSVAIAPHDQKFRQRITMGAMYKPGEKAVLLSEYLLHQLGLRSEEKIRNLIGREIRLEYRSGRSTSPLLLLTLMGRKVGKPGSQDEILIRKTLQEIPKVVDKMDLSPDEKKRLRALFSAEPAKNETKMKVYSFTAKVAGVFRSPTREERRGRRGWMLRDMDVAMAPRASMDFYFQIEDHQKFGIPQALIVVDHMDHVKDVSDLIEKKGYGTRSLIEAIEQQQFTYMLIFAGMTLIAVVTLLVACLGITNTMFMTVLERVREIGIMKAVGAADRDIRLIFLVEGTLIGLIGGLLGLLVGYLGSFPSDAWTKSMVESNLSVTLHGSIFSFPWWIVIGVPALACFATTLAAYLPARRASKINPVTALRHE